MSAQSKPESVREEHGALNGAAGLNGSDPGPADGIRVSQEARSRRTVSHAAGASGPG